MSVNVLHIDKILSTDLLIRLKYILHAVKFFNFFLQTYRILMKVSI